MAIERLQALYNQYFMGIEKLEPLIHKKNVERKFNELRKIKFYNTALRFRFQTQVQKYSTHLNHWRRVCRQIEEGTYRRDVMRAKARMQRADQIHQPEAMGAAGERGVNESSDDAVLPVFDLQAMLSEVEDAFEQGFDLDEQMNILASMPPPPASRPAPLPSDEVSPVGTPSQTRVSESPGARRSGIPIPLSSLKASRKTDEVRHGLQSDEESARLGRRTPADAVTASQSQAQVVSSAAISSPLPPSQTVGDRRAPVQTTAAPSMRRDVKPAAETPIDDRKIQSVYRAYMAARKKTNESTDNISLQKISDLLKKTDKAKGGVSDFKVVIRGGKAVIKAVK